MFTCSTWAEHKGALVHGMEQRGGIPPKPSALSSESFCGVSLVFSVLELKMKPAMDVERCNCALTN